MLAPKFAGASDTSFENVKLGKGESSLVVPPLGIGAWSWGDQGVWGYGGYDKEFTDASIEAAFQAAVKSGVTFFDTAEVYGEGRSEELLGQLLRGLPAADRTAAVVASKFYPVDPRTSLPRLNLPGDLITALDASRRRLGVDRIDLYQIHAPLVAAAPEAVGDALVEAILSGRCKAVGVSNYALDELLPLQRRLERRGLSLASNQVEYSLLRQLPETSGLLSACRDMGIGTIAYSPLAMGRLTGKYSAANRPKGTRFFSNYPMDKIEPLLSAMREIGERHGGKTPAQVALNWLMCKGAIPIPGAKNAKQAADNAGALGWRLGPEEVDRLAALGRIGGTSVWQHDGR